MFRTVPLYIIRGFSLYTQQWYMPYRFADNLTAISGSWSCSQAVSKPVWHIPLLCVQWKPLVDGQRNCLIYVEFYSKNKFEKSVHLVGFIIRIYHEARSRERQIGIPSWSCSLSSCQQTCMTHTIALCTVKNSWWWTEELSDICRFLFQK